MSSVLFLLSIGLNVLSFYFILILMKRISRLESQHGDSAKREIDDMLTAYLVDIRKENEKLLADLRTETADDQLQLNENTNDKQRVKEQTDAMFFTSPAIDIDDHLEQSYSSRALSLYDQGFSVTEIAKKLDKGKGEIELMLNLYRKS